MGTGDECVKRAGRRCAKQLKMFTVGSADERRFHENPKRGTTHSHSRTECRCLTARSEAEIKVQVNVRQRIDEERHLHATRIVRDVIESPTDDNAYT